LNKKYLIIRDSAGFGDVLLASWFTHVILANHINASFHGPKKWTDLIQCPISDINSQGFVPFSFEYKHHTTESIWQQNKTRFEQLSGIQLEMNKNYVPVKYCDVTIQPATIAVCTRCSDYSPCRNCPYFNELFEIFKRNNISYIDLNSLPMTTLADNVKLLNYVKKSRLYIGPDTGISHYVSQVANGKTLIIQSGFSNIGYTMPYDYDYVYKPMPCQNCFMRKEQNCPKNYECMSAIKPEIVYNLIKRKLKGEKLGNTAI
jgi:hypothetical protein